MDKNQLSEILTKHAAYLAGAPEGQRANLSSADLRGADLSSANLRGANLYRADLYRAELSGANLNSANLSSANLSGANLSSADLRGADLYRADLSGADLSGANLPAYAHCPQEGSFVAYKKLSDDVVAKLEIPADAKRTSSLVGRINRAEFVKVLELSSGGVGLSKHDGRTEYRVGGIVRPDSYDDDPRVECTNGIHFFITREEAEQY